MKSFNRAISLLPHLLNRDRKVDLKELATELNIPVSSIYRHMSSLIDAGIIFRSGTQSYLPHPMFLRMIADYQPNDVLAHFSRPQVLALSRELGLTVHFGVLEDDMVTYLVKGECGEEPLFTQEGGQLEAYCSGIGKMLLACLSPDQIEDYLDSGPFPSLTPQTITDPEALRCALQETRERDYAVDDAEVDDALFCVAIPVRDPLGNIIGALSVSSNDRQILTDDGSSYIIALRAGAESISDALSV